MFSIINPFSKKRERLIFLENVKNKVTIKPKKSVKAETYQECSNCEITFDSESLKNNLFVCPQCGYHYKISAYERLENLFDMSLYKELYKNVSAKNPIDFPKYEEKLKQQKEKSGMNDAVVVAVGKIDGIKAVVSVLDSSFLMGSMGTVVGEKITRASEYATKARLPLIIFSASGGARMQEGIFSLMQMAKTSAAIQKHSELGLLYISVMTNPTTGGVTASFASLGDIIIAEPMSLIGFAGPRVIKETIKQELPQGFQTAEYLLEHGFLDAVVERKDLKSVLGKLLMLNGGKRINA